jgi:hypothetical protein
MLLPGVSLFQLLASGLMIVKAAEPRLPREGCDMLICDEAWVMVHCQLQVALLSCESNSAGTAAVVCRAAERCWQACGELAAKLWRLVSGDVMDSQVQNRHRSGLPQLPVAGKRLSRRRLREMLNLLLQLVRQIEFMERVAAAAESLARRLPGCPALVEQLLEHAMALDNCSEVGSYRCPHGRG